MIAIISLLIVLIVSLIIVRVATVALTLTGVSRDMARFQARSAFTGAGFTTNESEKMVGHPVRRRIIMLLMLLGNAGIVTAVSSLILGFSGAQDGGGLLSAAWFRLSILVVALIGLLLVAHSAWVDRWMSELIEWALKRWTDLEVRDYASLLHLTDEYVVSELYVRPDDWLAGRSLQQLALNKEGVLVLGIERGNGKFVGAPRGTTMVEAEDTLLVYGPGETLADLDTRRSGAQGNRKHVEAVVKQISVERGQKSEGEGGGGDDAASTKTTATVSSKA